MSTVQRLTDTELIDWLGKFILDIRRPNMTNLLWYDPYRGEPLRKVLCDAAAWRYRATEQEGV